MAQAKVFEPLGNLLDSFPPLEPRKTRFSMCTDEFLEYFMGLQRKDAVIFGVETHVCVQQTALDLLSRGIHATC